MAFRRREPSRASGVMIATIAIQCEGIEIIIFSATLSIESTIESSIKSISSF